MPFSFKFRLIGGGLIIWIGLHAIAYGMWMNGAASLRNPLWSLLSYVLWLELFLLKLAALGALGFGVYFLWTRVAKPATKEAEAPAMIIPSESQTLPKALPEQPILNVTTEPTPMPKPPAPTDEDLKQKAIEQILGRY